MDPMAQQEQPPSQPQLCKAGCGFYSNGTGTGGLCSKCFREQQQQSLAQKPASTQSPLAHASTSAIATPGPVSTPAPAPITAPVPAPVEEPSSAAASASPAPGTASPAEPKKKPSPTRCLTCNKKVGLTGFTCRCDPDAVFCSAHRYAEAHACTFDYKAAQRQQLADKNPLVQADKLQRI